MTAGPKKRPRALVQVLWAYGYRRLYGWKVVESLKRVKRRRMVFRGHPRKNT